jgi:hypothetical protein
LTQLTMASGGGPTRQSRTSGRGTRLALRLIWLALLGHMLRSRRFYERMAVGAVVLAALKGINQESRASTLERLAAWNKKQTQNIERRTERTAQHIERRAERTAQHIERQAEREGKRLARKAKGQQALNQ